MQKKKTDIGGEINSGEKKLAAGEIFQRRRFANP
jgi:hypothetical protein